MKCNLLFITAKKGEVKRRSRGDREEMTQISRKTAESFFLSNKTQRPRVCTINMFMVLTTSSRNGRRKEQLTLKTQSRYEHLVTAQRSL